MEFTHHPDNYIIIDGIQFPFAFWNIVEPNYNLPNGYIGRIYTKNTKSHVIRIGNVTFDQDEKNINELDFYISNLPEYQALFDDYLNGAQITIVNDSYVVKGPPLLTTDKTQILNINDDTITITCDLQENVIEEIRWSVIAPDGTTVNEIDNTAGGIGVWERTTSHLGIHIVRAETDNYGSSEITFEGI
jgi:hypothetical protein